MNIPKIRCYRIIFQMKQRQRQDETSREGKRQNKDGELRNRHKVNMQANACFHQSPIWEQNKFYKKTALME